MTSKSELAPQEDQGIVLEATIGPPDATLTQMQTYSDADVRDREASSPNISRCSR